MAQETNIFNVFASKTGVLHIERTAADWHNPDYAYTWGTWKDGTVKGPLRSMKRTGLTAAGTVARTTAADGSWSYTYNPDAAHI